MKCRYVRILLLLSSISMTGAVLTGCSSQEDGQPGEQISETSRQPESDLEGVFATASGISSTADLIDPTDPLIEDISDETQEEQTEASVNTASRSNSRTSHASTVRTYSRGHQDSASEADSEVSRNSALETGPESSQESAEEMNSEVSQDSPVEISTESSEDGAADERSGASRGSAAAYESTAARLNPGYDFLITHPVAVPEKNIALLRSRLLSMVEDFDGTWSIYVKDLSTEESLSIHEEAMPSASTMKLFVMGAVYEAFSEGTVPRTQETVNLLKNMISYSSNEDTNRLLYLLGDGDYERGIKAVNDYIDSHGYSSSTRLYNPFQDESLIIHPGYTNQTTAKDCALLLEMVYRRTFGSRSVCNEIEDMLLAQSTRYKIPSGVGENAQVGNKTGETDTVENDVAIVYTPGVDYILCIFSTDWKSADTAQSQFTPLSSEVYEYFTSEDYVTQAFDLPVVPGWEEATSEELTAE